MRCPLAYFLQSYPILNLTKPWLFGTNVFKELSRLYQLGDTDTLILASKKFHTTLSSLGKLANIILATMVSLNYNILHKNVTKLATFQIHYLN